ncbi:hypothetical protein V6N13_034215 [Hibiscus sabdariffa]
MFTNAENVSLSNADNLSIHLNVPDHEESDHTNTSHANATEDPGHASHANEERGYTTAIAREDLGQRDSAAVRSVHSEAGLSKDNQNCVPILPSSSGPTSLVPLKRSTQLTNKPSYLKQYYWNTSTTVTPKI